MGERTDTNSRVMQLQAKGCQGLLKCPGEREVWDGLLQELSKETNSANTLIFD